MQESALRSVFIFQKRGIGLDNYKGKGKSTLNKHAGKHGYTSPEEYLKEARNFSDIRENTGRI